MGTSHLVMMGIHSQMSVAAHCVSAVLRKTGGLDCRAFFSGMQIFSGSLPGEVREPVRRDLHSPLRIMHGSVKAAAMSVAFRTSQF